VCHPEKCPHPEPRNADADGEKEPDPKYEAPRRIRFARPNAWGQLRWCATSRWRPEQNAVDDLLVLKGNSCNGLRYGEDHMKILGVEKF